MKKKEYYRLEFYSSRYFRQMRLIICRRFSKRMGLEDTQWIACTHKDTDNLHIHLIANRMDINNVVYDTKFVSNKASQVAEQIAREMGLTIANEVHKQKEYEKQKADPTRLSIKQKLQSIAYAELRNKHPNPKSFFTALQKRGVIPEFAKNKQDKIYGLRFQFEGQTFKASEIGKEFGLRSLYNHFGISLNIWLSRLGVIALGWNGMFDQFGVFLNRCIRYSHNLVRI